MFEAFFVFAVVFGKKNSKFFCCF